MRFILIWLLAALPLAGRPCRYPHLIQIGNELHPSTFLSAVGSLKARFRNEPPTNREEAEKQFAKKVYEAVANRADLNLLDYHFPWTPEQAKQYQAAVAKLGIEGSESGGYRHFTLANFRQPAPTIQQPGGPPVRVQYKSYFTVPLPKKADGVQPYVQFTACLPALHRELTQLNEKCNGCIQQFKIPPDLESLTARVDSLVIHYTDPKIADEVNDAVARAFGAENPFQSRPIRGGTGFDFAGSHSHGQLIAELTARYLVSRGRKSFMETSDEELARQLRAYALEISRWSPEQVYRAMYLNPRPGAP